jgi:putative transposase
MFEQALETARLKYGFFVLAYVVMPEHVHLLVTEPEISYFACASPSTTAASLSSIWFHPSN